MEKLLKEANGKLPRHIGIIPDGNRRWARARALSINQGHLEGYETVKKTLYSLFDAGIRYLTIYALSLENARKRSQKELDHIYKIIKLAVEAVKQDPIVKEESVKINVIGRLSLLPDDVMEKINELIDYTKDHKKAFINICIMYLCSTKCFSSPRTASTFGAAGALMCARRRRAAGCRGARDPPSTGR